jgi:hypothetical protein
VDAKRGVGGEKTNFEGKSKKGFLAVTLVTVLSILAVIGVYAVLIGTFTGGQVTVGSVASSNITYSSDNATGWTSTLSVSAASDAWYSRLEVGANSYSGPVTITWQLQNETAPSTWNNVGSAVQTSMVLSGSAQDVYASSNGASNTNFNWGSLTTTAGAYRVYVTVNSA